MRAVFIDTMTLIWSIQQPTDDERASRNAQRAIWLMDSLKADGVPIYIATITLAEFLRGCANFNITLLRTQIEEAFLCCPFDNQVAEVAARAFKGNFSLSDYEKRKAHLKADLQIIATAIAKKASILYTNDKRMRKLAAKCGLEAKDLPTHSEFLPFE